MDSGEQILHWQGDVFPDLIHLPASNSSDSVMEPLVEVQQSLKNGINWNLMWVRNSCRSFWMERGLFVVQI